MQIDNPVLANKAAFARKRFPLGTFVRYYPALGRPMSFDAVITSEPWVLGCGTVVVKISAPQAPAGGVHTEHLEVLVRPPGLAYETAVGDLARAMAEWHQTRDAMPSEEMFAAMDRLFLLAGIEITDDHEVVSLEEGERQVLEQGLAPDDGSDTPYGGAP